ncbi:MAG: bifunctional diguanylate cyclase/phosphodiesterase, partial [Pseudoxanthomonas sp.]
RPHSEAEAVRASMHDPSQQGDRERVWIHQTRDGRLLSVNVHSSDIQFNGRMARLVLSEDVSERIAYERDLAWRASHDATTGLLTLAALTERLDAMPRAAADGDYAVAYVQLRDLELVAPTLGRRAGEAILRAVAERFGRVGAAYGYVAYLPGESFVVAALDGSRGEALAASLIAAIADPVQSDSGSHPLEAWIGVAQGPVATETAENVVGHAALAALRARRENVPTMAYDASMSEEAGMRLALFGKLRNALARDEFELFYQPIRHLGDGRVVAMEALLRWRQAQGGYIPPMQFIPLCEESGLIVPIGAWVLEEAARAHGMLARHGLGDVAIAVNVSAVQFLADSLPGDLRALRKRHALPRGALHLELTESVVLRRPDLATALMDELQSDGACISIDDFGTGFSSMAYLRDLPLDYLKVDRTFVHNVDCDPRNASICRALIELGHGLGLEIIAEGVETEAQLQWLRAHGCDQAQGYYLGRPAPLGELLATLSEGTSPTLA